MVLALGTRTALMAATGLRSNMKPIFGGGFNKLLWFCPQDYEHKKYMVSKSPNLWFNQLSMLGFNEEI